MPTVDINSKSKKREDTNLEVVSVIISMDNGKQYVMHGKDLISIYFIEDIFSHCITGKIEFLDMYGFQEFAPFTGEEQIRLVYGVEDTRELLFDIWKMESTEQTNTTQTTAEKLITLYFVDTTFKRLTVPRYSRSWETQTKGTEVIEHIFKYMVEIENYYIEPSNTKIDFIMPYWSPLDSIRWILPRLLGTVDPTSGYMMFNNTKNTLTTNVKTLNNLFSESSEVAKAEFVPEALESSPGSQTDTGLQHRDFKILDWKIDGIDHISTKGLQGGTWRGYDFLRKKLLSESYTYDSMLQKTILLGRNALFSDISNEYGSFEILGENNEDIIKNHIYAEWVAKYSRQQAMSIIMAGSENRYAGMQINMKWPSSSEHELYDANLKGRYLIKSITHMFSFETNMPYRQRLVLLKNAYESSRKKELAKGSKKNIGGQTLTQ